MNSDRSEAFDLRGVRDIAALVGLLRELKERSGLTLRELEGRAQARGELLARSTVSDMLRGTRLPGPETLAAYVRACGAAEADVPAWLEARQRAEEGAGARPPETAPGSGPAAADSAAGRIHSWVAAVRIGGLRRRTKWWVLAGTVTAALAAISVLVWTLSTAAGSSPPSPPASSAGPEAATVKALRGFAEIRPARTPHLCLTEGRDTRGEYLNAVAAQLPCEEARPPHTYLRPVDPSASRTTYFIEWQHPQHGRGCLTLRREGPGQDLLEPWPWKSCDANRPYQHFRIEPVGRTTRYLLRLEGTRSCVGLRDDSTKTGADVTVKPCDGTADQEFLISSAA
ncbi:helix-turn-helix domain-containing protein [Streptomyces sp. NBC_00878]|uniref:helix-turn-helix domain-containing protein n=1 Tax=Streptomyces sp. NBC_00878 TaxID=2975854 RepID=UPI002254F30B|nr:helix-turn-helix domain-containing protein [Streptomyces sp. NBC_00878]MCX4906522.1 helix-turn-helix domain-containing protein [Streptomyces sp. NBC_00878]